MQCPKCNGEDTQLIDIETLKDISKVEVDFICKECDTNFMEAMEMYFAYGSNLHIKQMSARCTDSIGLYNTTLNDYKLTFRRGVATIEPQEGEQVYGAIYVVSPQDKENLDGYEGYPHLYDRKMFDVNVPGIVGELKVFSYFMYPAENEESLPSSHYLGTILEGYDNWDLPRKSLIEAHIDLEHKLFKGENN